MAFTLRDSASTASDKHENFVLVSHPGQVVLLINSFHMKVSAKKIFLKDTQLASELGMVDYSEPSPFDDFLMIIVSIPSPPTTTTSSSPTVTAVRVEFSDDFF